MDSSNGILALVRHGESEWNAKGIWTGWTDIGLTDKGREEGRTAGRALSDIRFHIAYTSALVRAKDTLTEMLTVLGQDIPVVVHAALNERNYGIYTKKNKQEMKKTLGEEEFMKLRRSWDYPIPQGESHKEVHARVVPYFNSEILPRLKRGEHVLVSAHGNSLRALVKELDGIPEADVAALEIATGEVLLYTFDSEGRVVKKEKRLAGGQVY